MKKLFILLFATVMLLSSCGSEAPAEPSKPDSLEVSSSSTSSETVEPIEPIINLKDVFGKSQSEIKEMLGEPDMEDGQDIYYKDMMINIYYVDDKAATATIKLDNGLQVARENYRTFFELVGLKYDDQEPSNIAQICTEWENVDGMYQISVFSQSINDKAVESIYVISKPEYKK